MVAVLQAGPGQILADLSPADLLSRIAVEGALLLRGFGFDLAEFEALSRRLCDRFHAVGTRVKLRQPGDGYTSEVFRDNFSLLGHSEGTYRPWPPPPDLCFFGCVTPPSASGGETLIVDGVALARALPAALRQRLEASGVTYESHWGPERWQAEFGVADAAALEQLLAGRDDVRFDIDGDRLDLWYTAPAFLTGPGGLTAFANGVLAHLPRISHPAYRERRAYANPSNRVYFGDGEELSDELANALIDAHDRVAVCHQWEAGDLLLVNNRRVMHGRRMTEAPCERVLLSRFGCLRP